MEQRELCVRATDKEWLTVSNFLEEILEENNITMAEVTLVLICAEEIFINIAHYAYGEDTGYAVINASINTTGGSKCISISFIDEGQPYNPLKKKDPDVTLGTEERSIGGLGIYIVKQKMDKVNYVYENGKNIFSMEKNLG